MRAKKILSIVLVMVLLASAVPLLITSAGAQQAGIPCDDGDNELTKDELVDAILPYMLDEGEYTLDEVGDAAWVYAYWNVDGVGKPKTITDSAERTVTIYRPVERIIMPNGDCMPVMRAIRASDKIVGVNKYTVQDTLFYPEFSDYPNIGSVWYPEYEVMAGCEPDTVILYGTIFESQCTEIENTLKGIDSTITFIWVDCYKPGSGHVEEVTELGYLLDVEEEAEEWIDFYEGVLNPIEEEVNDIPEENRTRVYLECWHPYHTAGQGVGWHQKLEMAGGHNIFGNQSGYFDVDAEDVAWENPEVIIRSTREGGFDTDDITELRDIKDEIMNRPELAHVDAVENNSVYIISSDIYGGVEHFVGISYIAKWLYPDKFQDLDPKAILQEYLTRFQNLDYNVYEHGVFVYHPELHPDGK